MAPRHAPRSCNAANYLGHDTMEGPTVRGYPLRPSSGPEEGILAAPLSDDVARLARGRESLPSAPAGTGPSFARTMARRVSTLLLLSK
jgi:hypothetical protein